MSFFSLSPYLQERQNENENSFFVISLPVFRRGGSVDHLVDLEDPASGEGAAVEGLVFFFVFFVEGSVRSSCFFFFFFFFFRFPRADRGRTTEFDSSLLTLSRPRISLSLSLVPLRFRTSRSPGREPPAPALFRSAFSTSETSASAVIGDAAADDQFPPLPAAVAAAAPAASSQSARRLRPREDARESAAAACEEGEAEAIVFPCYFLATRFSNPCEDKRSMEVESRPFFCLSLSSATPAPLLASPTFFFQLAL